MSLNKLKRKEVLLAWSDNAPANITDTDIFTASVKNALSSSETYRRSTQTYCLDTFYTKGLIDKGVYYFMLPK